MKLKAATLLSAIQALQTAGRYEAGTEFWPQYLRGQAYLKLGRGAEAAAEFQKILDHRGQDADLCFVPAGPSRSGARGGDERRRGESAPGL